MDFKIYIYKAVSPSNDRVAKIVFHTDWACISTHTHARTHEMKKKKKKCPSQFVACVLQYYISPVTSTFIPFLLEGGGLTKVISSRIKKVS